MKKRVLTIVIFVMAFACNVSAQDFVLKFEIYNNTGVELNGVYVTQADVESWGEDIIPGDVFSSGLKVEVTVPVVDNTICIHDIKITDFDNNAVIFENVDFCNLSSITLFYEDDVLKYIVE